MVKLFVFASMMLMPVAAYAGQGGHGGHGTASSACAALLMAAIAVLGYWVLKQNAKDKGAIMWAGRTIGWSLAVCGLLGFFCSMSSLRKAKRGYACKSCLLKKHSSHKWSHKHGKYDVEVEVKKKKSQR